MGFFTTLLIGFLSLATLNAVFCNGGCIERERQALLKLKQDMVDPSGRLASWVADDEDCCKWKGVVCDNVTSHVLELCLRTPTVDYDRAPIDQYEANERSKLGGKVSPSLLNLKHLRYLDLSNNNFGGIQIPKFFGSLRSLILLDLSDSGFVGEVPHHLGNLSNLKYLNLSSNFGFGWNFGLHVENFHWLSGLSSLQYLDMKYVNLSKATNLFPMVNTLPSLVELHLVSCEFGPHVEVHPHTSINLSSLVVLDLSKNLINKFSTINWVFSCKNLVFLTLSGNSLEGPFPFGLQNLTFLKHLDLSSNSINSSIPDWLNSFRLLQFLDLSGNSLEGPFPGLQNLTFLKHLDLSYNSINSLIPNWLNSFRLLQFLDLSYNNFDGEYSIKSIEKLCSLKSISLVGIHLSEELSSVLEIFLKCSSITLESLDLSSCQLSGQLPNQLGLGDFKILRKLILSNNSISGPIPTAISGLPTLKVLHLFGNKLEGSLPESFGTNLKDVDISNNFLKGVISEIHFVNFTNLKTFDASGNPLMILKVNPNWIPPFQIVNLGLSSWHLGPEFPQWLHFQKNLKFLDISNSRILDTVPSWFWELSQLFYLNISANQIQGQLPSILNIFNHSLDIVDFSSNNFTGPLPYIYSVAFFLDLSNNNLSGSLFPFLCHEMNDSMSMGWLNLGKKFLSGELPDCWTKWPHLEVLVLSDNKLTGGIPRSIGTSSNMVSLHLQKNYLSGKIPFSLSNCAELLVLDLNENKLNGSIPPWMGHSFPNLKFLNLRSNEFWGQIPNELCSLSSLQFLDLAQNNLSGGLPSCFGNISVLLSMDSHFEKLELRYGISYSIGHLGESSTYLENADVVIKGQKLKYDKTLYLVEIMDFSSNQLTGEIPWEITNLKGLISLNLSHNLFTGRIPKDIGNMRNLLSIDFSVNKLSGSIPESMSNLTFLEFLNLSNNQLVGRIPSGTQLQSFNASSYEGNKLCGRPLATNCSADENPVSSINNRVGKGKDGFKINWLFVSMTLGFIVGFWSVVSPLVISRRWRRKYYQFLDEMWGKISFFVSGWF